MIKLCEKDYSVARDLMARELINPINRDTAFCAAAYCLLSVAEKNVKHIRIYNELMEGGVRQSKENIGDWERKFKREIG